MSRLLDPTNTDVGLAMIDQYFAGKMGAKRYCFIPVFLVGETGYGLGVAEYNEPGFWPISSGVYTAESWDDATEISIAMNEHIGLTEDQVIEIIAASREG